MIDIRELMDLSEHFFEFQKIEEAFDKPLKYIWFKREKNRQIATSKYEEYMFSVIFLKKENSKWWSIFFKPVMKNGGRISDNFDRTVDLLKVKAFPIRLFSTVIKIIKDWIDIEDPYNFVFEVEEPKREKLYSKIISYLRFELKTYQYNKYREGNNRAKWMFTKKGVLPKFQSNFSRDRKETLYKSEMIEMVRKDSKSIIEMNKKLREEAKLELDLNKREIANNETSNRST